MQAVFVAGLLAEGMLRLLHSQVRYSHSMRTDLSSIVPRDLWNVMPDSCGLKSDNGRFRSSWKKNCASSNRARSTDSLPACTQHKLSHKGADGEMNHASLKTPSPLGLLQVWTRRFQRCHGTLLRRQIAVTASNNLTLTRSLSIGPFATVTKTGCSWSLLS